MPSEQTGAPPGPEPGAQQLPDDFPPPDGPPTDGPGRSIPALLIVAVCLLALVAGTWLAGGFEVARGRLARLPVGTEVNLGPMSFSAERALVRRSGGAWSVYVFAHCRNNSDQPLVSTRDRLVRNGFSAQHPVTARVADDGSLFFGAGETIGDSSVLNPGTPLVPCSLVFSFTEFPPTDFISVGASALEWIDASPTGEGEMVWSASRTGYRFDVPLVTESDDP